MSKSKTRSVAIATYDGDPPMGPHIVPLRDALRELGVSAICQSWQSPDERAFSDADLILPVCAWNYAETPDAFAAWIDRISAAGGRFGNAPALMKWNMNKAYLTDLAARGVPVPPTVALADPSAGEIAATMARHGWHRAVIKPAIGQSGNGVQLIERGAAMADAVFDRPQVLQPFLSDIGRTGELTMTFFSGVFSHAVRRCIPAGEWRANAQYGVRLEPATAGEAALATAHVALAALPSVPLYARIDGIETGISGFVVTEVELIEPSMFFHLRPDRAASFAATINALVAQHAA